MSNIVGLYAIKEKTSNVFVTNPSPYKNDYQAVFGFKTMIDMAKEKNDLLFSTSIIELIRICTMSEDNYEIISTEQKKICSSSNIDKCIEVIKEKVNEEDDDEYIH